MRTKNKKAAIEMSLGTIVMIVLVVAFLIIGIMFLSKIREGGNEAIEGITQATQNQINSLFSEDSDKKVIVIPESRLIKIKKGTDNLGFGFSIRNVEGQAHSFSYAISAEEVSCDARLTEAESLIVLGKERSNINIGPGSIMEDPIFVRFNIPDSFPPCQISYSINVKKDNQIYGSSIFVDLEIKSE